MYVTITDTRNGEEFEFETISELKQFIGHWKNRETNSVVKQELVDLFYTSNEVIDTAGRVEGNFFVIEVL